MCIHSHIGCRHWQRRLVVLSLDFFTNNLISTYEYYVSVILSTEVYIHAYSIIIEVCTYILFPNKKVWIHTLIVMYISICECMHTYSSRVVYLNLGVCIHIGKSSMYTYSFQKSINKYSSQKNMCIYFFSESMNMYSLCKKYAFILYSYTKAYVHITGQRRRTS